MGVVGGLAQGASGVSPEGSSQHAAQPAGGARSAEPALPQACLLQRAPDRAWACAFREASWRDAARPDNHQVERSFGNQPTWGRGAASPCLRLQERLPHICTHAHTRGVMPAH